MRKKITFDEYDIFVDRVKQLKVQPSDFASVYKGSYFPTVEEIRTKLDAQADIEFILWLLECQEENAFMTPEQKESRKLLQKMAYDAVNIVEKEEK